MVKDGSRSADKGGLKPEAAVFIPRRESGASGEAVVAEWQPPKPRPARDKSAAAKRRKRGRRGTGDVRRNTRRMARAIKVRDAPWTRGCVPQQVYCAQVDAHKARREVAKHEQARQATEKVVEEHQGVIAGLRSEVARLSTVVAKLDRGAHGRVATIVSRMLGVAAAVANVEATVADVKAEVARIQGTIQDQWAVHCNAEYIETTVGDALIEMHKLIAQLKDLKAQPLTFTGTVVV